MHRTLLVLAAMLLLLPPAMDAGSMLGPRLVFGDSQEGITLHQVLVTVPPFGAGLLLTLAHYLRPATGVFALGVGVQLAAAARLLCLLALVNLSESLGTEFVFLLLSLVLVGLAVGCLVFAFSRAGRRPTPASATAHLRTAA